MYIWEKQFKDNIIKKNTINFDHIEMMLIQILFLDLILKIINIYDNFNETSIFLIKILNDFMLIGYLTKQSNSILTIVDKVLTNKTIIKNTEFIPILKKTMLLKEIWFGDKKLVNQKIKGYIRENQNSLSIKEDSILKNIIEKTNDQKREKGIFFVKFHIKKKILFIKTIKISIKQTNPL